MSSSGLLALPTDVLRLVLDEFDPVKSVKWDKDEPDGPDPSDTRTIQQPCKQFSQASFQGKTDLN